MLQFLRLRSIDRQLLPFRFSIRQTHIPAASPINAPLSASGTSHTIYTWPNFIRPSVQSVRKSLTLLFLQLGALVFDTAGRRSPELRSRRLRLTVEESMSLCWSVWRAPGAYLDLRDWKYARGSSLNTQSRNRHPMIGRQVLNIAREHSVNAHIMIWPL